MVTCTLSMRAAPVACNDVARTYVTAVGGTASAQFTVTVKRQGDSRALCESTYDVSGAFMSSGGATTTRRTHHTGI
jgi:hypothetical protein